jgi:S1-C subfamily serine protease
MDGRQVTALEDFSRQAASVKSGSVTLTLNRDGASRTVTLTVDGAKP